MNKEQSTHVFNALSECKYWLIDRGAKPFHSNQSHYSKQAFIERLEEALTIMEIELTKEPSQ